MDCSQQRSWSGWMKQRAVIFTEPMLIRQVPFRGAAGLRL
jgi:hypothetical protein